MFKKIGLLLFVIVFLAGCKKKYPDDTALFHTRSPFKRLTSHGWFIKSAHPVYPSLSYADCGDNMGCRFYSDGTSKGGGGFIFHAGGSTTVSTLSYNYFFEGNWELIDNNNKIKVTNDATHYTIWTIKELDRRKMKLVSDSVEVDFD